MEFKGDERSKYNTPEVDWGEEEDHHGDSCLEEPYNICFSGHDQGPKAYLRWERDMEDWFQSNKIKHEERTTIAEETLTDEAFLQWEVDACLRLDYELPDRTWEEMKQLLREEFVENTTTEPYYPRPLVPSEPRRCITITPSRKVASPKAIKKTSTQSNPITYSEPGRKILGTKSSQGGGNDEAIRRTKEQLEHLERTEKLVGQALKPPDPFAKYQPPTLEVQRVTKSKRVKEKPPDPSKMKVDHFTPDKKVKEKPPDPSTREDKKIKEKPPDPPPQHRPPHHAQGSTILRTKSSQEGGNDEDIEPTSPRS